MVEKKQFKLYKYLKLDIVKNENLFRDFLIYIFYNKNKKLDYKYNLIDKNYNKLIENI